MGNNGLTLDRPTDIVPYTPPSFGLMPALSLAQMVERRAAISDLMEKKVLIEGSDYGVIPGTGDKKTLFKAGAERLGSYFGLSPHWEVVQSVEDWTGDAHHGEPFFYYWYRCHLLCGGMPIVEADGSANSHEKKYRWRWVQETDLPAGIDKSLYVKRASEVRELLFGQEKRLSRQTDGKYGKPLEYWDRIQAAIDAGQANYTEAPNQKTGRMNNFVVVASSAYRVPNDEIASEVNTLQKMAQKRAFVAAILLATNASEFFTQDLEDKEPEPVFVNTTPNNEAYDYGAPPTDDYQGEQQQVGKPVDSVMQPSAKQRLWTDIKRMIAALPPERKEAWGAYTKKRFGTTDGKKMTDEQVEILHLCYKDHSEGMDGPPVIEDDEFATPGDSKEATE